MKTRLLFLIVLFHSISVQSQTNGWYQFMGISSISTVQVVDTSPESLLIGTNIGLIEYNTSTQQVANYLNLTNQSPAIGTIRGISQNPTNNEIALETDEGFAIYDGTNVMPFNYNNSGLTVGETGFQPLKTSYGIGGELYLYKTDIQAYQIFNNGTFAAEVATSFRPTSIVENISGTKVYFGGWNNGVWELDKSTSTYTNYTTSNSGLLLNTINKLFIDQNDLLYISTGGYVGFNTLDSSGNWNTYQEMIPSSAFHFPVFDFDVSPTTGKVLVNSSATGVALGLFEVDLPTNTWIQYTNDNTNCLNTNSFTDAVLGTSDTIYAAKNGVNSELIGFMPSSNSCSLIDINYLNFPNLNFALTRTFDIRKKSNGNLEIGFADYQRISMVEIDPITFNGALNNPVMELNAPPSTTFNDVMANNGYFIVDKGNGLAFIDPNNNISLHDFNVTNFSTLKVKKSNSIYSLSNLINLAVKGFSNGNYLMQRVRCNILTGVCEDLIEIFTNDRDLSQNVRFDITESENNNDVRALALKINGVGNDAATGEKWEKTTNAPAQSAFDEDLSSFPLFDPVYIILNVAPIANAWVEILNSSNANGVVVNSIDEGETLIEQTTITFDPNNNGTDDKVMMVVRGEPFGSEIDGTALRAVFTFSNNGTLTVQIVKFQEGSSGRSIDNFQTIILSDAIIDNFLPSNFIVYDAKIFQYDDDEILIAILTNYGFLIKTGIDISEFVLDVNELTMDNQKTMLYPNPATDLVSFSNDNIIHIEVYDINGRRVLNSLSNSISVKPLSKGIYIIKGTTSENNSISKKLIKN